MSRLPIVGGDAGNWGTILNDYLQVSLARDGTVKSGVIGATQANLPSLGGGLLLRGTFASRPTAASGNSGLYYLATDNNGGTIYQSTGSAWVQAGAGATHGSTHSTGGPDALTGNLDATARLNIAKSGTVQGTRRTLNFIAGTNVTITTADDSASEKVDITIAATGGSSGLPDPGTNGIVARTNTNTTTARTITGTTNQVTVTNGDGVLGNPTLALPQNIHSGATPTFAGMTSGGNIIPGANNTYTVGSAAAYWSQTYAGRYYFNSTAYLDGNTAGDITVSDATDIALGSTTGTKIGTSATQKLGFYNTAPVVQPTGSVLTALSGLGLVASPTIAATDISLGTLPLARGGTGGTDAATARTSLAVPQAAGFAKISVSTVAPTSPTTGDLWVDTNLTHTHFFPPICNGTGVNSGVRSSRCNSSQDNRNQLSRFFG